MIRPPEQIYAAERHQSFAYQGDDAAPTALLVHGFTGTPSELYPLGTQLNQQKQWSTACDLLPGFGKNIDSLGKTAHQDWLAAVREHWEQIQPKNQPTVLIGFSAGGAMATCVAAEFPPDYLVLIAPFSRINHPFERLIPVAHYIRPDYLPYEGADFSDPELRLGLRDWLTEDVDLDDPEVQEAIRGSIKLPMSAVQELRQLGQQAIKSAPLVQCPTLIIQGADDPTVTPDTTRQFATSFGGLITYHELPGDHHVGHNPENSLDMIANFITSNR